MYVSIYVGTNRYFCMYVSGYVCRYAYMYVGINTRRLVLKKTVFLRGRVR